jgi:hypothetical protein
MSTHDSDRPPSRARRLVLRKIAPTDPAATAPPEINPQAAPPPLPAASPPHDTAAAAAAAGRLSAPAPALGSRRPPAPSIPSFDPTPGGGTPLPTRTRASLPPVVANLAEAQATEEPAAKRGSTGKAGLVGAAAGLVFVGLVVVGARLAYRLTPPEAPMAVTPPAAGTAAAPTTPSPASAAPLPSAPSALATGTGWVPVVEHAQPRRAIVAPRAAAPAPTAAVPKVSAEPAHAPETSARTVAAVPSSPAPNGAEPPAAAESATSLVPVIPSSPPPEQDPFVKAILEDDHK